MKWLEQYYKLIQDSYESNNFDEYAKKYTPTYLHGYSCIPLYSIFHQRPLIKSRGPSPFFYLNVLFYQNSLERGQEIGEREKSRSDDKLNGRSPSSQASQ